MADGPRRGNEPRGSGAFKTISEVADVLDIKKHVLRFWEQKFPQLKPMKRGGGRRYYRP
ncbi:MAG: MerR family transcriptional regulator, partial [Pseudomonadota bacterium]